MDGRTMKPVAACAALALILAAAVGAIVMNGNMSCISDEDNAFAKECNNRGGVAKFEYSVRKCIGAQSKGPQWHRSKN